MTIAIGIFLLWLAVGVKEAGINKDTKNEWILKVEKREEGGGYDVEIGYYWIIVFIAFIFLLLAK